MPAPSEYKYLGDDEKLSKGESYSLAFTKFPFVIYHDFAPSSSRFRINSFRSSRKREVFGYVDLNPSHAILFRYDSLEALLREWEPVW